MDEIVTQVGVGGIFALLLIDRVLRFVKEYKPAGSPDVVKTGPTGPISTLGGPTPHPETDRRIDDVHEIVSRTDDDGVPRVYVPKA